MPDGSNLSSILPSALPQFYNTPEEGLAAGQATAPAASAPVSPAMTPAPPPAAPVAAAPPVPTSSPSPAVDALPQFFNTPEEGLAAGQAQPASSATPPPAQPGGAQPPQESGFFSGLLSGAGAAVREGVQTASGNAFTTDPNAQPEPQRGFFNEVGYGLGHSFPVVGAGLAGGALGETVGPVGAVVGAAGGVGAMSVAQALAPSYAQGIQQGLSHDEAVNYALKHAAAEGVLGAATAPLFSLAPFKSLVGKLLFSSLVTQPAAGAATRVGEPLLTGEPLPSAEDLARGYGQDVASGVAFGVGHEAFGAGKRAITERPAETPPAGEPGPTAETPPVSAEPTPAPPVEQQVPPPVAPVPPTAPPDAAPSTETGTAPAPERTEAPAAVPVREEPTTPAEPASVASVQPVPPETVPPREPAPTETGTEPPPSPASIEPVTLPPDDGRSIPAGPEPTTGVGAPGAEGLPAGEPGGVRPGDTTVGAPDTQGAPPADQGQTGATAPPAETGPTGGVTPTTYTAANPHPQSIATQIDQLEQLGRNRTSEQTDQLQELYQQRQDAEAPSPEAAARRTQISQLDTQISTLGAQITRAEARKNNQIAPSKSLIAQRAQLDDLIQQRRALISEHQAAAPAENQRVAQNVFGPPKEDQTPAPVSEPTGPGTTPAPAPGPGEITPPSREPGLARPAISTRSPLGVLAKGGRGLRDQAEPSPQTPTGDPQLDRLIETRNRATTNPNRFADLDRQITARQQTLQAKGQGGPRVGGRKQGFSGPPEVKAAADPIKDYKFNNGTSVYTSVFEQAGHDPRVMVNRPMEEQNAVLTAHMKNTLGFRDVAVEGRREGSKPTPVDQKIARDAMLDMTRATQDLMSDMGQPYEAAGDFGRLRLVIDPEGSKGYYGQYSTAGEIRITGGANSFGHEWAHAMDHKLADRLMGAGNATKLLTRYAREGVLDPKDGVQGAVARLMNVLYFDKAAQAARQISLQKQGEAVDRLGNPTKAAIEAQRQLALLEAGGSRLRIQPSEYREGALRSPKPGYYADPAELFARAHEAWMAWKMEAAGHDPRGAVMPDAAYIRETNRMMGDYYPQAEDRMNIFKAFDDLHDTLRNENVLSNGKTPQGPANLGISDPLHYGATVPPGADPQAVREIGSMANQTKALIRNLLDTTILTDRSRPGAEYPWYRRMADYARGVFHSHHGIMETVIGRAPDRVKPLLREMLDRVAAAPGEGRYTPEHFEEAVRKYARGWTDRFAKILTSAGYKNADAISNQDGDMLRHVLTTGETRYPTNPNDLSGTGPSKPIPDHLLTAGRRLRQLMDEAWRATHDAGIDVGYARSGYYPRMYDAFKVTANEASKRKFLQQSHVLHSTMFDQEMGDPGSDPTALLEKWTTLSKADRESEPRSGRGDLFTLTGHMNELRKNLRRQAAIEAELQAGPNPALDAELAQKKLEATQIAEAAHPMLRDHIAGLSSDQWLTRLMGGGQHDFDTAGPSGKYLKARVLPPEADQIMREFMRTSPTDALPNYFHAAARRIAFAERFGANGEDLDAMMDKVRNNLSMNTEDANWFHQQMLAVTGQQNTRGMAGIMKISNYIHAGGQIVLMPRAAWSALAEPMNAALATGSMRVGFETFANQFGQLMRTASARERTEMAEYLSTVTSAMHDSIMLNRSSADYADSPAINKFMTQYYRITGLTQLTNSQRIAVTAASNGFLAKLSRDYQGTNAAGKDTATRWFRELGLNDPIHGEFAKWMTDFNGGRPTVAQLQTDPMAGAYSLAVRRLTDRIIQDPYKVDRAALASTPFVGLAFQLMSFNYQFQRNVLQPAMDNIAHAYKQRGMLAAAGSAVHAASMAGTMVLAGILTTAMRQYLFAPDQWQKHEDDGDLGGYLLDLAMQRSGLNGTLDPIIQMGTNLRYDASMSSLLEGASVNWLAKNAQDVITPFVMANDSPNTNTRYFNAARGAFNLVGVPAAAFGLTKLGAVGGAVGKAVAGAALQFGTSPGAAAGFAGTVAGEKGSQLPKDTEGKLPELPGLAGLPSLPSEGGEGAKGQGAAEDASGGLIPWGLADDVAKPAWQVLGEPVTSAVARLPGPVKALGALGAAAYGAKSFLDTTAPWRGEDARPPKAAEQTAQP